MISFKQFLREKEEQKHKEIAWKDTEHKGWWRDGDHMMMYHGTHESKVPHILKHGLKAPEHGPTAGNVSLTHDKNTAHGYAAMSGESDFRAAGGKARHIPHDERAVVVHRIPREWAEKHMDHELRGNTNDHMKNKEKYDAHKAAGKPDHEYYQSSELRFKTHVPPHFIVGVTHKVSKK